MSNLKTTWTTSWARLKRWRGVAGLPVLPPVGALIELAALVALIVVADWAFPSIGISTLEPSPYWVPVLLLSLQYGTVAGLAAAAAATAVYVFNGVVEQVVGENFFAYLLRIWALPILWIGVALVLGQFRLRQIAEKQSVRQSLAKRTDEAQRLASYAGDLEKRCHLLERQLTTRANAPAKPVLDALATLAGPNVDISAAVDLLANKIWPGAQLSVFTVTPRGCEISAHSGWPATAPWSSEIPATHPLYKAVIGDRRAVSILSQGDETILAGQGVAAHPILTADGSGVVGMFKIEMIDPSLLDKSSIMHLQLVCRLIGIVLAGPRAKDADMPSARVAHLTRAWKSTVEGVQHSQRPRQSS